MVVASDEMLEYFKSIEVKALREFEIASKARSLGFDPKKRVEISFARNIGERVEGLVSAVYPGLKGSGLSRRILELEELFEPGDWRVGLTIARECAEGKFLKLGSRIELLELGVRVGLAYITQGTVSAPLEGVVGCKEKKRRDGGTYVSVFFSGPIRAAGGTAEALTVLLVDFLRRVLGYDEYDPSELEVKRYFHELELYDERVSRLQYFPSEEEVKFLVERVPVELNGSPTSKREVILFKEADRVETTRIRGGMCLVLGEGLAQKAKKLLGGLSKFSGDEFLGLDYWVGFLKEFVELQNRVHSKSDVSGVGSGEGVSGGETRVLPSFKYLHDAVGGRPIISHPSHKYGFRIRYGRTRVSGSESFGFNPVTLKVLDDFLGVGTQLKVERPGKGCTVSLCDVIRGPVVKLVNGDVVRLDSLSDFEGLRSRISEVLFLGDVLVPFGAFREHKHVIVPSPFVEEWWAQLVGVPKSQAFNRFSYEEVKVISLEKGVPLHPGFVFPYDLISISDLLLLVDWLVSGRVNQLDSVQGVSFVFDDRVKRVLEDLLVPHRVVNDCIVLSRELFNVFFDTFGLSDVSRIKSVAAGESDVLKVINSVAPFKVEWVSGFSMGARMGRPEKAKLRRLATSPHLLFPVGEQGGRLRSVNAAFDEGFVEADFPLFFCSSCNSLTIFGVCDVCGGECVEWFVCSVCKAYTGDSVHCGVEAKRFNRRVVDVVSLVKSALSRVGPVLGNTLLNKVSELPFLVKGVRGTSSENHVVERLEKGVLRAFFGLFVNKDGTIRFDMTEQPITHFKPCEIGTSVEKLRELGYSRDVNGDPLVRSDQLLELKPQDVILPVCDVLPESNIASHLVSVCKFLDGLLVSLYGLTPYFNVSGVDDLVGLLGVALAPHTSAGTIVRVIGFSRTQSFLAHPLLHAACRRDCDGDELGFIVLLDALLNFSHDYLPNLVGTKNMDAPLVLALTIDTSIVDDEVYNFDVVWEYPISFYELSRSFPDPGECGVEVVEDRLGRVDQFEGFGFTHPVSDFSGGNLVSVYKLIPTMDEKVAKQMELAFKVRAIDSSRVAELVIERHFIRDIKGNLRKFSSQVFRCVKCNEKFRRVPLLSVCSKCGGRLVLTVHEGSVVKYLRQTLGLARKYSVDPYLLQCLELLEKRVASVFGLGSERQESLVKFFGKG